MKLITKNMTAAAEVLAGRTGYSTVEYRGVEFSRPAACSSEYSRDGDISIQAAKKYIREGVEFQKNL